MRLIDAEALEEDFYDNYDKKGYRNGKSLIYAAWCLLKKLIEKAPTIEAKPVVHAHWEWVKIEDGDNYFELAECSHCRGQSAREYPYCRYCGAQMDEFAGDINVGSKTDELVSNTDGLNCSEKPDSCDHIAEGGKKEPICGHPQEGMKIPVISMEDVPKILDKLPEVSENPILREVERMRHIEK